jgi:hypothetical protein
MADNTTENQVAQPVFSITLNGKSVPVFEHKVKKGLTAGDPYFAPNFDDMSTQDILSLFPDDVLRDNLLLPTLRRSSLSFHKEAAAAAKDDQEAYKQEYEKLFSTLSARGESIKALNERKNELLGELAKLNPTADLDKFLATATKIANLEKAIAEKRAKDEDETPAQPAQPATVAA